MDTEMSGEVLDVSEPPQQDEAIMEKEVVSKLETQEELNAEPEKSPAADEDEEEGAQLTVNGHDVEVVTEETTELIVTENVTVCVEKTEIVVEESSPVEKEAEMESVPEVVAPPSPSPPSPDPVESSENIPDPVAALDAEPQKAAEPEQQHVPESDPEPVPEQTPLAVSAPEREPEPEKPAETVPEADTQQEQTSPEPTSLLPQSLDTQPPSQEKEVEADVQAAMDTVAEEAVAKEEAAEKIVAAVVEKSVESVLVTEASPDKPEESVALKEEAGRGEPAEGKKEPEKPAEPLKELAVAAAAAEGDKPEEKEAEVPKEVEEDPDPAPGSLSFALLEREQTKDALKTSRTLVILRGLPGSGKSFLARAIVDAYKPHCSVLSADDHAVKPENPGASADAYKALDEAVVACCSAGAASPMVVVVDDTNHTQDRLGRLGEIAEQHHLVAIFLEPRTEWSRDPAQLSKKTRRGLEEAQLEAMRGTLEDVSLPLYFGWFLLSSVQEKVRCTSMDFLKTLDTLEAFKKHLIDFTGKAEKEVDLEQYFQAKGTLHCTTKFCDYGKAEGAKEYAQIQAVKDFYGSAFELSLSALFVTPRTVGAKVSLTEEQLLLWPADAEKEAESAVPAAGSLPLGSRAHVTIGCAEGVEPVQTGLDLLQIEALQKEGQQGEPVEEMELGSLRYFGEGRWLLTLREPICAPACFSSFYGSKGQEPTKKEPEKKKQKKCTIL